MLKVYSDQGSGNCYKVRLLLKPMALETQPVLATTMVSSSIAD